MRCLLHLSHEQPERTETSIQNIKDRFYGTNDPVASKILRIAQEKQASAERRYVSETARPFVRAFHTALTHTLDSRLQGRARGRTGVGRLGCGPVVGRRPAAQGGAAARAGPDFVPVARPAPAGRVLQEERHCQ